MERMLCLCKNPSRSQLEKPLSFSGTFLIWSIDPVHRGMPEEFCGGKGALSARALLWSSAGSVLEKMENIFHPVSPCLAHMACTHILLTYHLHYFVISASMSSLFKWISSAGCLLRWLWWWEWG